MADRQVLPSNTFEQFRVEFNELATDVGDIANLTGASGIIASATDVIEAITTLNTSIGNTVDLPDSSGVNVGRIKLGDSDDIQIYHDGSNSFISDGGTGEIRIQTNNLNVQNAAGNESMIGATEDAGVALYFNNSQKLVTNNTGVSITENLTVSGNINNGSVNLTFPTVGGAISTEGFSIALATALG